jgi:hypothetical protein
MLLFGAVLLTVCTGSFSVLEHTGFIYIYIQYDPKSYRIVCLNGYAACLAAHGTVSQHFFSGLCADVHDCIRVGATKQTRANAISVSNIHCAVLALGMPFCLAPHRLCSKHNFMQSSNQLTEAMQNTAAITDEHFFQPRFCWDFPLLWHIQRH